MILRNVLLCAGAAVLACSTACVQQAAPDTREADTKAVSQVEADWSKAAGAKDVEKFAAVYAADATMLMPNAPAITGAAAIKEAMKPMFSDPNFALDFKASRIVASKGGDLVYSSGTYNLQVSDEKTKKPMNDKGKYITIYKKQADGAWKAVEDMISSDLPVPSAGGSH